MTHVLGPTFLHQDMVLLHQQEKIVMKKHMEESPDADMGEKWKDKVFIPTGADKMTVMFYKWFRKNATPFFISSVSSGFGTLLIRNGVHKS